MATSNTDDLMAAVFRAFEQAASNRLQADKVLEGPDPSKTNCEGGDCQSPPSFNAGVIDQNILRVVLDQSPFLTAFIDRDLRYQYVNHRYAAFHGKTQETMLGRTIPEVDSKFYEIVRTRVKRVLEGVAHSHRVQMADPNQSPRWLDVSLVPKFDDSGQVGGFFCFVNDVTESQERERLMDLVFSHVPASIALFDRELRFRFANEQLLNLFGYTMDQVIGRPVGDIIDKDLFAVAEPNLILALRGEERSYENVVRRRDGSELNVLVRLVPEKNMHGETTGICALLVDTSALKQARLELLHNELRFQTAVEGLSVGVIEFDFQRPEWVFAKHIESLLGFEAGAFQDSREQVRARIHPDDLQKNDDARLAEYRGQDTHLEIRLMTSSGVYRWFSINSRVQMDEDGKPQKVTGTVSDIDDLKNTQLKAAEDVKRRDEFLAMLSHELRNPMAAITFSLDCLNEINGLSTDVVELVDIISRQTTQMSKLMQDLLDISRLTQNRIVFEFIPHDLNASVPEVVNSIRPAINKKRQCLNLELCDEKLMVSGDVARLKQAIANLLDNASKYTDFEGEIWLETKSRNGQAVVSIRDSGFGIETSTLGNIFELFFQERQPLHRKSGGIGVGLFLVDQIVKAHQGTVLAESAGLGHGSQFSISIPLSQDHDAKILVPPSQTLESCHIVVVEDNTDSRRSLSKLLQQRGHTVTEFENGESAAQRLDSIQFDIAIIDIGLPGKNGLELAREIRQQQHLQSCLLVAMTGYSQIADRESVNAAGFDLHVVKPTNVDKLCVTIANLANSRK